MNSSRILQWNVQGLRNEEYEILELINDYSTNVIAIQETKVSNLYFLKILNYNANRTAGNGNINRSPHGGVALYIHFNIPFNEVHLNIHYKQLEL